MILASDITAVDDDVKAAAIGNAVRHLRLSNFRNYSDAAFDFAATPIVLTGSNGAGKTNMLEALSFLSPGRGLRGINLAEADAQNSNSGWAVSAIVASDAGEIRLGTGRDVNGSERRRISVDGEQASGQQTLAEYVSVLWLTPAMDGLFTGSASERRRFFDRITYSFFPDHAATINRYERAVRERNRLLAMPNRDNRWLDAAELQIVHNGLAVAASRNDTLRLIEPHIGRDSAFPAPLMAIDGDVERKIGQIPALEVEDWWRSELVAARGRDAIVGRTSIGVHRSDFIVRFTLKNQPASLCSTGEQKALMLSLVMAVAKARRAWTGRSPILLLDEVVAHLDQARRESFFGQLVELGVQAWITGTDAASFAPLKTKAQFFTVKSGQLEQTE